MGFHKNYSCSSLEVVSVTVNWSVSNLGRSPFFLLLILCIHFGSSLSSPFSLLWSTKVLQCLTPVCGREVGEWRRKSTSSVECLGIWCGMEIWYGWVFHRATYIFIIYMLLYYKYQYILQCSFPSNFLHIGPLKTVLPGWHSLGRNGVIRSSFGSAKFPREMQRYLRIHLHLDSLLP